MSSKIKWRESFQKARSQSQGSLESQTKRTSLLEEDDLTVADEELEEYLGTLKKKSGVSRLWTGHTFEKVLDRTPDVSISSVSDGEGPSVLEDKSMNYSDDDFRPNILALSHSEDEVTAISEPSSIKPMEAVHMISDLELSEGHLDLVNNVKLTMSDKELEDLDVAKEVRSVGKYLSENEEPNTLDEVAEEIEDMQSKHSESAPSICSLVSSDQQTRHKKSQRSEHSLQHSSHRQRHHSSHRHHRSISNHGSSRPNSRKSKSQKETSSKKSDYSYDDDFSDSVTENTSNIQESSHHSTSFISSASSASMKSQGSSKKKNQRSYHDASTQVNPEDISTEQKLGIGMATLGPSFGHQYIDPSPIACHVVSADAVEALTAYNPAIVALTDMLRQQLRLVEQFVDNSRRMYQSYSSNLNTSYNYTTLEDTLKYIQENNPIHRK